MKVQIRPSSIQYEVLQDCGEYYILHGWSPTCYIAVKKSDASIVQETYKCGQRFRLDSEIYILAQTEQKKVALISLSNGNRWTDPISVWNVNSISQSELQKMATNHECVLVS